MNDKIDEYASEVNLILTVLGKIDQDLASSVLTNSSKFEDFDFHIQTFHLFLIQHQLYR